jgi:hypothetical protein
MVSKTPRIDMIPQSTRAQPQNIFNFPMSTTNSTGPQKLQRPAFLGAAGPVYQDTVSKKYIEEEENTTNNTSSRLRNIKKKKEFKNKQPIRSIHMFPEEG